MIITFETTKFCNAGYRKNLRKLYNKIIGWNWTKFKCQRLTVAVAVAESRSSSRMWIKRSFQQRRKKVDAPAGTDFEVGPVCQMNWGKRLSVTSVIVIYLSIFRYFVQHDGPQDGCYHVVIIITDSAGRVRPLVQGLDLCRVRQPLHHLVTGKHCVRQSGKQHSITVADPSGR